MILIVDSLHSRGGESWVVGMGWAGMGRGWGGDGDATDWPADGCASLTVCLAGWLVEDDEDDGMGWDGMEACRFGSGAEVGVPLGSKLRPGGLGGGVQVSNFAAVLLAVFFCGVR